MRNPEEELLCTRRKRVGGKEKVEGGIEIED